MSFIRDKSRSVSGGGLITSHLNPPPIASTSTLPPSAAIETDSPSPLLHPPSSDSEDSDSLDTNPLIQASPRTRVQPTKKRKLDPPTDGGGGAIVPPPKKPRAKPKPKANGKGKGKGKEPEFVTDLPWPDHFVKLEKTFKALNTVYTFCSARKSMATTFDTLKGGVENLLRRPLEISDIAQMKSLLPDLITFAYIDSELLRVHSAGADDDPKTRRQEKTRELDEAYELAASVGLEVDEDGRRKRKEKEVVLLFAFNDGELKGVGGKVVTRKAARKASSSSTPRAPSDPTPKVTTASMTSLITKRNTKFSSAISELLVASSAHQPPLDALELLLSATSEHLPVHPSSLSLADDQDHDGGKNPKSRSEKQADLEFYQRNPEMRPTVEDLIEEIRSDESWYKDQIVPDGHRVFPSRSAVFGTLSPPLSPTLSSALLSTSSITSLYSHQSEAINLLAQGHHVIVATATSSGKSLIYQIPMLQALEKDGASTGLYVFPTKALAQDQMRAMGALLGSMDGLEGARVATFDGDTPREDRDYIRDSANIIFTNPDMLHLTILPREESWRRFFQNLKLVVVDELHTYAGLFGSHVAFVMRRLRRVCAALGNHSVQFVSCSATISNPVEHMQAIFGISDVVLVDSDGSPTGRKEYVVWNPPFVDDHDRQQGRVSTLVEASRIFRFLMERGVRAIVFCKVRMQCEILMKQVRSDLMLEGRGDMAARVMAYRSGYSAADRRKIEQEMFSGKLLGVIATTALELGIDIGSLDAVLTVGFPYTLPGLRQQAGRAGRRNKDSLAMLICDPFPVDQHYASNPSTIFSGAFASLAIDLENPIVREAHLQCAAFEMPIHPVDDVVYFGERLPEMCEEKLVGDEQGYYHAHERYKPFPAKYVPIRNTEDDKYDVVDVSEDRDGRPRLEVLEEVEFSRAIYTCYEGAVFMHQGRTFLVKEVDHDRKIAKVAQANINWRTRNRDYTNVDPVEALAVREIEASPYTASYGTVQITSIVFGYYKTDHRNNILDVVDVSSPPFIRSSHGLWIDVPRDALDILAAKNLHEGASIHAAEHAIMSLTPIVAMSIEGDVKTECKLAEKELGNAAMADTSTRRRPPRIILYDSSGKSGGICAKAFDHISHLLRQAADTIANCACAEGCPSCVASTSCSGANLIVSKLGALVVLSVITGRELDIEAIPVQEKLQVGASASAAGKTPIRSQGPLMETEELGDDEREQRERELASLFA